MDIEEKKLVLKNVRVHNLKNVSITLPKEELIVFTGVSGSGKSSLAFDTIYVEGQRRFLASLSHTSRRALGGCAKPEIEQVSGISPTIAIEQKIAGRSPRSTVGTMTGIYDHLRVLFARIGKPHCPVSGEPVGALSREKIIRFVQEIEEGTVFYILYSFARKKKGEFREELQELMQKGYTRVRIDQAFFTIDSTLSLDGKVAHDIDVVVDRIKNSPSEASRTKESVIEALDRGAGMCLIYFPEKDEAIVYSETAYSKTSGISYPALEPIDFSFNHPRGMCASCQGLGQCQEFSLEKIIVPHLSIAEGCCLVGGSYQTVRYRNIYENLAHIYKFSVHTPWNELSKKAQKVFLYGTEKKWTEMLFVHPEKGTQWVEYVHWKGVLSDARERLLQASSERYRKKMQNFLQQAICPYCQGERLQPYPRACLLGEKSIGELTKLSLQDLSSFLTHLKLDATDQQIAEEILKELERRVAFLIQVGLQYLSLDRISPTLSGGESQRVRLASQIGSGLVGAIYVLDEPSIGLHPEDHTKLIKTLHRLRDLGNTVIVVEHDPDTIAAADTIVDMGPLGGAAGGEILVQGTLEDLCREERSLTGSYLAGRKNLPFAKTKRTLSPGMVIEKASHHNLQEITVAIPLKGLVCVTGVSGSGKSSLVSGILYPALANHFHGAKLPVGQHQTILGLEKIDKVIHIDQSPIGRTPRSNPATYIQAFSPIRDLYASLPESQLRGLNKGHFSFNVAEGSCSMCQGVGQIELNMDFMDNIWIPCTACKQKRFTPDVLSVKYGGKSIYEVLEMRVTEAREHFQNVPNIEKRLALLEKVGLGYMKLGQSSPTLSGGEAQRIKLARELVRPGTGQTLYILDEPTTGLHLHDLSHLLYVLHTLVDQGNTVLVIEHNIDFIKTADWIIDLGPKAGEEGGRLMGEGSVAEIQQLDTPTGRALKERKIEPPTRKEKPVCSRSLCVKTAEQNNLKGVDLELELGTITAFSGPSGSGKSSLAFDTIYAEGQRRYIESLSTYAKSFLQTPEKPKVGQITNLLPSIAIEQTQSAVNPRSTIGTLTEIYDLLRVFFAHMGTAYSPETGEKITMVDRDWVAQQILDNHPEEKLHILSPLRPTRSEDFSHFLARLEREGFLRIRLDGVYYEVGDDIPYLPQKHQELFVVVDRLMARKKEKLRLFEAIGKAATLGDNVFTIAAKEDLFFNLAFSDPTTGKSYPKITPQTFSFNAQEGMCPDCQGIGSVYGCSMENMFDCSIGDLFVDMLALDEDSRLLLEDYFSSLNIPTYIPLEELTKKQRDIFLRGSSKRYTIRGGAIYWKGLETMLAFGAKYASRSVRERLAPWMHSLTCPSCKGTRLQPLARHVRVSSITLPEFCALSIDESLAFLGKIEREIPPFLQDSFADMRAKFSFLQEIGLGYLSLNRTAPSLSGGELQRIRLARQLGSGLTSCLYVLDEPTTGLHPHNNLLLNQALQKLQKLGNTLLVVEHDPMTLQIADTIVDFGPGAGYQGGTITAKGTLEEIKNNPASLTGAYLSGRKQIQIPPKRKELVPTIQIEKARVHNLQNISFTLPKHAFICITGVSGSGKTSLMEHVLQPAILRALREKKDRISTPEYTVSGLSAFDKVIVVHQALTKVAAKSDVASYSDALTPLRSFYASLQQASLRGLLPVHFSYHHKRGMCKTCYGLGYREVDLQFLPSVRILCESCAGHKLGPKALEVSYKGKHLGDVLQMSIDEAALLFADIPKVCKKLDTLQKVGLGYLLLGQKIQELSGGEKGRIRLAKELTKRSTGKTLYLVDEPTTGLHLDDLQKLLTIFQELVDKKNTLIAIEHTLDFIRAADYIVDMGPGAGKKGGRVVATGTPEQITRSTKSLTGKYLR